MERWVMGTVMVPDGGGTYSEAGSRYFNMPNMYEMHEYLAENGQTYTHIENEFEDVLVKEAITHFLP